MNVRPAAAADVQALFDLEQQCPTAAHWSQQQYKDLFAATTETSTRTVLVVGDPADGQPNESEASGPRIHGFLIAHHIGPEWELENIAIAPTSLRKGLASQLLAALLSRARETNSESVFLEVRESNQAARALYARHRFEETGRRRLYYANPAEDAILYRLTLTRPSL